MKKILIGTAVLAFSTLPVNADDAPKKGFYLPLRIGYSQVQDLHGDTGPDSNAGAGHKIIDKFSGGTNLEAGIGYDFGNIRTELNYTSIATNLRQAYITPLGTTDSARGDVAIHGVLVGAYYDFENKSKLTPYAGGAIGGGKIAINNIKETWNAIGITAEDSGSSVNGLLLWSAKIGMSYDLSKKFDLFVEGVYYGTEGFTYNSNKYDGLYSFGANIGTRFRF